MEENELQEAITQYKEQLNQIEAVLQTNSNDELNQLKDDLVELIKTTEESLLCVKKTRLLGLLSEVDEDNSDTEQVQDNASKPSSSLSCVSEIENSIAGTRCKAPYTFEWGVTGYYNAMVLNVEEIDDSGCNVLKVRVLFTNPTHRSMVPCPYLLDEKCRYDDDECRYSHGHVVNMAELKAYVEPDFSLLKVDGKCLAKYEDGVWYKATILSLTADDVDIHYDTYNMDKTVKLEDVLPMEDQEDDSDGDSSSDNEGDDETGEENVIAEFCQVSDVASGGALGDWERHTKGIASKLMAKMGYIFGKGLGKNEDGRVEPVEIILLPTGKSLDACAELREKNKLKQPFKRKKKKGNDSNSKFNQVPVQDVFDFINNTLGGRKGNIEDLKQNKQPTTLDRRKSGKTKSDRNYNLELFKLEQEKSRIQKMLHKQMDSASRSNGKGANLIGQTTQKILVMQGKIRDIEKQERMLKQKIHQNNEHKKLTVF